MTVPADDNCEDARDKYRRQGYLLRKAFFTDEIVLLTALIDRHRDLLLEREDVTIDSRGDEASNLGYLGHGNDVITSFASTARLLNLVGELLADQVYLLKGRLNIKWGDGAPARRGGWDPHQDRAAWAKEGLPGDAALTAAIAIDASDEHNGTLELIPGSHAGGILEHTGIDSGYGIREEIVRPLLERNGQLPVEMAAGDMVIFSGDMIHLSEPNLSGRRRALLFLTYNALSNCPPKGVGPSRYQCTGPLRARDDRVLADLARELRAGRYTPELDWAAIQREREIDIAEDIDSGWTELTPTLRD
ncbi:MAG: ectoine hydroxylase [Gammaproteobacteria bacterium]|nr:MAG: ectoine hydroxylase [Gammaproteobacteria bacterium]